ncbi:MAG: M15 family metallopeptidase [Oscillospiraceae bacterium]|nr:M15 family metallopeptidase [Oscillospiraceae bacterium]
MFSKFNWLKLNFFKNKKFIITAICCTIGGVAAIATALLNKADSDSENKNKNEEKNNEQVVSNEDDKNKEELKPDENIQEEKKIEENQQKQKNNEEKNKNDNNSNSQKQKNSNDYSSNKQQNFHNEEVNKGDENWAHIMVNKSNPLPKNYSSNVKTIKILGKDVDTRIVDPLMSLINHAKNQGINIGLSSAFRSNKYQEGLFNMRKKEYLQNGKNEQEAYELTSKYTAPPGTSEHETGLAIDFASISNSSANLNEAFANTVEGKFLQKYAFEHGFILRYPEGKESTTGFCYEPWHYRYVGEKLAKEFYDSGLKTLEEFFEKYPKFRASL